MRTLGSIDSVTASIREEANAELERLRVAAPVLAAERRPPMAGDGRRSTERKRNDERLAQAEWDEKRRLIEQREAWIARVIARGNEILAQRDEATIERLVEEAKQSIRGEVQVEIAPRGGVIVRAGAIVVDNSYEARARRLEPVWRKTLAGLYRV